MSKKQKRLSLYIFLICSFFLIVFLTIRFENNSVSEENKLQEPIIAVENKNEDFSSQKVSSTTEIIGTSVEGRSIEAITFGKGATLILFVGGIHGGYEWNSTLLAYTLIDHLAANSASIPENVRVTIIPTINPDGLYKVIGKEGRFSALDVPTSSPEDGLGRFNAHNVDLNRNFACKWQPESTWKGEIVQAGTQAFSEPEAIALKDFVTQNMPSAVIFWHSKSNAVYASECENGVLPNTLKLMQTYANASGYPAISTFDAYEVTGDAEGWLASIGIPAITVELKTHEMVEWEKNLLGINAILTEYGK
jgi:hypothetical protein